MTTRRLVEVRPVIGVRGIWANADGSWHVAAIDYHAIYADLLCAHEACGACGIRVSPTCRKNHHRTKEDLAIVPVIVGGDGTSRNPVGDSNFVQFAFDDTTPDEIKSAVAEHLRDRRGYPIAPGRVGWVDAPVAT